MERFKLHQAGLLRPRIRIVEKEIRDHTLPLSAGCAIKVQAAFLRDEWRKQPVNFRGGVHLHSPDILSEAPFKGIVLNAPAVTRQRRRGEAEADTLSSQRLARGAREAEVLRDDLTKFSVTQARVAVRPRRHPSGAETVQVDPRASAHIVRRQCTQIHVGP